MSNELFSSSGFIGLFDAPFVPPLKSFGPAPIPRSRIQLANVDISAEVQQLTLLGGAAAAQRAFTIYINGVDRSSNVLLQRDPISINYSASSGSRGSCSMRIFSRDGSYRPAVNQEVLVYENENSTRIFGGIIANIEETNYKGQAAHEVKINCSDFGSLLERAVLEAYFEPPGLIFSPWTMVLEILRTYVPELGIYASFQSADGTIIDTEMIFSHIYVSQAIQQICEKDGLDYFVDAYKGLHLVSGTTGYGAAPFNISDNDGNTLTNSIRVRKDGTKYANKVGMRASLRQPAMWHEVFTGNGVDRHFITRYVIEQEPLVFVNDVAKTVVEYGNYGLGPHDFSWGQGSYGVFSNPYAAPYTSSDRIDVYYPGKIQPIIYAQDDVLIASDGREIVAIFEVKDVEDQDLLLAMAQGNLARLKVIPYLVDFPTLRHGLMPGQLINVNLSQPLVPNLNLIIQSVSGTCGGRNTLATHRSSGQKAYFKWTVTATNAADQGQRNPEKLTLDVRKIRVQPQDRHRTTLVVDLYETLPGVTNPGLAVGITPSARRVDKPGFLKHVAVRFEDFPPQVNLCRFNCLYAPASNPTSYTSVFANGEYIEVDVDQTATVVKFNFTSWPFPVGIGDQFKAEIVTADSTAKDGKMEIEIQG